MLKDRKILNWAQPVTSLDDKPKLTAAALKAAFDSNTNELKPAVNGMIDDLTGTGGAGNVGTSPIDGVTGTDVQTMLAFLKGLIDLRDPTENVDNKLALKADKAVTDRHIKTVGFNGKTGVFTFTREDGTSQTVDTMLEKVPVRCYLDGQAFVLVLEDGTEQRADLSAFLTKTEFTDSATIDFAVSGETVTASVRAGSITLAMLESTVMSTLQGYMTATQTAAGNAKTSETNAAAHKDAAAKSASASAQSAAESAGHAKNAQSWAAGGTGTRAGEDTDNAKHYANKASESADDAARQMTAASTSAAEARESAAGAAGSAQRAEQAAKDAEAIAGGNFIPMSQKGEKNGVASLDASGKVPSGQLPEMNYAPASHVDDTTKHITAGERQAWNAKTDDTAVDAHKKDKNNPHGVTAAQMGAPTVEAFNGHTGDGVKHVTAGERTAWNGKAEQEALDAHTADRGNPHRVTAAQIGAATAADLTAQMSGVGNLHVWKRTQVVGEEIPARYELENAKGVVLYPSKSLSDRIPHFAYADSISVSNNGVVSLNLPNNMTSTSTSHFIDNASKFVGKFVSAEYDNSIIYKIGANFTFNNGLFCSSAQRVIGQPLIPAGTNIDYLTSTNRDAYQESSGAKPAGYTLGEIITGEFVLGHPNGAYGHRYQTADTIKVSETGVVSAGTNIGSLSMWKEASPSESAVISALAGKFVMLSNYLDMATNPPDNKPPFDSVPSEFVYIPEDVSCGTNSNGKRYINKYQPVYPHPAIPANTTIEYLGQIGGSARCVFGSYAGNGASNRMINLGFTPSAVLVQNVSSGFTSSNYQKGGLVVGESNMRVLEIVENGFLSKGAGNGDSTNEKGIKYNYIAWR